MKMDSEEIASTLNLMPEHLKGEAKNKFRQLSGFAQGTAEDIKKFSSQAVDKVEELSDTFKTKLMTDKDTLVERTKPEKVTFSKDIKKVEKCQSLSTTNPSSMRLQSWFNEHGTKLSLSMFVCVLVYFLGYFQFSFLYIFIPIILTYLHQKNKEFKKSKLSFSRDIFEIGEEAAIKLRIDETLLPSWFQFPDVEQVEWINRMMSILWPHLATFMEKTIRQKIEPQAKEILETYRLWGFKFNSVNFGQAPPRIEGLKVYTTPGDNEIVADLDLKFSSSQDSRVSISVIKVGASICDIQFSGQLRIILKPLISDMPIVGGIQVFFLKPPSLEFDLGGAAQVLDLPGINGLLKSAINAAIADQLVNPNRLSVLLTDKISPVDLKMPHPIGVLVVEVIEAKNLPKMDVGFSKCDPYVVVSHGRHEKKTSVGSGVNPFWKESLAFAIEIPESELQVLVLDRDTMTGDDFIGQAKFNVTSLIEAGGAVDTWITLEPADGGKEKLGQLHLKLNWLKTTTEVKETATNGTAYSAVLSLYLDSVQTRPIYSDVPEVCVKMSAGDGEESESLVVLGRDPVFQEGHVFLLKKVEGEEIIFNILDMTGHEEKGEEMASFKFPLSKLVAGSSDLSIKLQSHELQDWKGRIRFAAQLRYLAQPINKGEPTSVMQIASGFAGSSKKMAKRTTLRVTKNVDSVTKSVGNVTKSVGSATKNVSSATTNVVRSFGSATGGAMRKIPSPFSNPKISREEKVATSQPFALETNLDGDEDSFENLLAEQMHPKVLTDMSHRSCQNMSEMSGQQMIEKRHSSDSSSENGQHQSNVRRRLSEGLKSFSFRK